MKIFHQLDGSLAIDSLKTLASGPVQCHFDYACTSWFTSSPKHLKNKIPAKQTCESCTYTPTSYSSGGWAFFFVMCLYLLYVNVFMSKIRTTMSISPDFNVQSQSLYCICQSINTNCAAANWWWKEICYKTPTSLMTLGDCHAKPSILGKPKR